MTKIVTIPATLDTLPMSEGLSWERFQSFCSDVLSKREQVKDCREYLQQGNAQEGIDIYAFSKEGNRTVAQCKLTDYLSPGKIDGILDEFLNGSFAANTAEFILCTTASLNRLRDEEEVITKARARLAAKNITLVIWDEQGLSQYLRTHPEPAIVYHYFQKEVAVAFYGDIWENYLNSLQKVPKIFYPAPQDHIQRSIQLYAERKSRPWNHWTFFEEKKIPGLIDLLEFPAEKKGTKIVLLSVAGFGKTQELLNTAAYFCSQDQPVHPVRYILKDYEGQSIEELLEKHNTNWRNIPPETLLLLFDGLDEIKETHFESFINHLNMFSGLNTRINIVVSSRFNFYDLSNPSLREFDVYVLQALSRSDIKSYLTKKLESQADSFIKKIENSKFADYSDNPYYLTRLVRFYKDENGSFPKNKSELFNKILFEKLSKDAHTYNIDSIKEILLPVAEKIAFCMVLTTKSNLKNQELALIVPVAEQRKQLRHFCIMNYNEQEQGSWSFEHKNLQEYLCANFLARYSFSKVHDLISFSFNRSKLLPRFLNTVSFLFEILDNKSDHFKNLFNWLHATQSELFVRFEKEQLQKETRKELFKDILHHYHAKNLPLYTSSYLSHKELGEFAEVDGETIDYLGQILATNTTDDVAYDALIILSSCPKPYLYQAKLLAIYFGVMQSDHYPTHTKAQCIYCLQTIDMADEAIFKKMLSSGIDLHNFDIRKRLIYYLEQTPFTEQYLSFVLESIPIYKKGQAKTRYGGANDAIERILVASKSPASILKILAACVTMPNLVTRHYYGNDVRLEEKDIITLIENAQTAYVSEPRILAAVYRLTRKIEHLTHQDNLWSTFLQFFRNTCGYKTMFQKIYRYDKLRDNLLYFADKEDLDRIAIDYAEKNIQEENMFRLRNRLSWIDLSLSQYLTEKLVAAGFRQFYIEQDNTNYKEIQENYAIKNQLFLYDKQAFLQEVEDIFRAVPFEELTVSRLNDHENIVIRRFRYSAVKDKIASYCRGDRSITKETLRTILENENEWLDFSLVGIRDHLQNESNPPLLPEIEKYAKNWLKKRIEELDFANSIRDNESGGITYLLHIEFVKEMYRLLNIELDDHSMLKMLQADYEGFYTNDKKTSIATKIATRVQDKLLLKQTVIDNIRSKNLATWVLVTHFKMAAELQYQEILPDLYKFICSGKMDCDHEKTDLLDCYLKLGGEAADFIDLLQAPQKVTKREEWKSWQWHLLKLLIVVEPDCGTNILLEIARDELRIKEEKIEAIKLLLNIHKSEGLELWCEYIRQNHQLPFELQEEKSLESFARHAGNKATLTLLFETLEFAYDQRLISESPFDSIHECAYTLVQQIAAKDLDLFDYAKQETEKIIAKYSQESFQRNIKIFMERLLQTFYENHEYTVTLNEAVSHYAILTENP